MCRGLATPEELHESQRAYSTDELILAKKRAINVLLDEIAELKKQKIRYADQEEKIDQ